MKSVRWMARNHVAANLLMAVFLVGGLFAAYNLTVAVFPEIELDIINITVAYPGAGPKEVEEGICQPIEEAIYAIDGIERVSATASEGGAAVIVEVMDGADTDDVLQEVKSAVDRIVTFPQDAERPVIAALVNRREVISVAVYGDLDTHALRQQAEKLRDELLALPEITQASINGVPPPEISIEISEENLRRYGLTLERVAMAIRAASVDLPAGAVKAKGGEILLRTKERRYAAREYEDIVVLSRPDGTKVTLRDIADVREAFAETDEAGLFEGKPAAMVGIYRVGDQTPTEISRAVRDYVAKKRASLPPSVKLAPWNDRSEILQQRVDLLLRNAMLGLVLVIAVLGLLMEVRLAFWVTLGIPISMLGSMVLMPSADISINMLSLFAFILVLGIVVDDAIVVGENIYAHHQMGKPYSVACPEGAIEVGRPVIFSVLTTVAAFAPLLFVAGRMGKFMKALPFIVISVLLVSLVESLLILPAHLNRKRKPKKPKDTGLRRVLFTVPRLAERTFERVRMGAYRKTLKVATRHRYSALMGGVAMLMLTYGTCAGGHIKQIFLPELEADDVHAKIVMPFGTPAEQTEVIVQRIVRAAQQTVAEYDSKLPEGQTILRNIYAQIGSHLQYHGPRRAAGASGGHLAQVAVFLKPLDQRGNIESNRFAIKWRERVGEIAGAESADFSATIMRIGSPIDVQLAHDDFAVLEAAAEKVKKRLAEYPGIYDIADSYEQGKGELKLKLRPEARTLGITEAELARQVRSAFYGAEALRLQRGRNEVRVMVRYPLAERRSLANVDSLRIRTPAGGEIPFAQAAQVDEGQGYSQIKRMDRKRVINVTAKVDIKRANAAQILEALKGSLLPQLTADHQGLTYDLEGEERERRKSMLSLAEGLLVALALIYGLLAVPLRSYGQPLIIMTAIPFGVVGAVFGHVLLGYNMSLMSNFGVVALSGVVVNDSLLLVDFINRKRAAGQTIREAVIEAGLRRFRPVIMTTLTTFFALVPMLAETSVQARFLVPMAISLAFGVLFATAITLVLVPSLYLIFDDIKRGVGWLLGLRPPPPRELSDQKPSLHGSTDL